jgi:hypothetical protein
MASITIAAATMASFGTSLASSMVMSYRSRSESCPSMRPTWRPSASVISYLWGISGRRAG